MKLDYFFKDYKYKPLESEVVNCPKCKYRYTIEMKRHADESAQQCITCNNEFIHYKMYY